MARLRTGSGTLIRDLNRSAILALIRREGRIARIEIALRLALSPATVTTLTRELVGEGLVEEVDQAPSNGGRPAILLGLIGDAAHGIGVKIAADRITAVDVNFTGEPLAFAERPFDASVPDAFDRLGRILAELVADWSLRDRRLLGIGLGVPGVIDMATGTVDSPTLGWRAQALGPRLRDHLGLPVLLDNDVNTLAVAERLYGRGTTVEDFVTVTIGRGIGLGIVAGGDLYRGAAGGAGELGHVRIVDDGPTCECGKRGCLEAVVADAALVRTAVAAGVITPEDGIATLRDLADDGDQRAREVFDHAGRLLGRAVAGLVNILGPGLILVSGEGSQAWRHYESGFEATLREDTFEPLRNVPVEVDPWDDAKWARGAASLVLRATFSAPLYEGRPDDAVRERLAMPVEVPV